VDIAIDYNEEAHLPVDTAREIERFLRARGVQAVRSSVHVNVWAGRFDKRSTSLLFLRQELGLRRDDALARCIYLGDSFNDAPMFGAFAHSVGVAQVRTLGPELTHAPAYVTRAREGRGAEEVLRALAAARKA
jgi:hydroxymethylpyrimidine pyrophosphatase-like HAD family hydrolase